MQYDCEEWKPAFLRCNAVRLRGMETGISETCKRVSIFPFANQGGKKESFYLRQGN